MAFKDYNSVAANNTALGDGTYIGPNMLRNKVRPALQQIAADGKELADQVDGILAGSSDEAFTQAGAGAVSRTVLAKLRETVSVKDFGATGDGTTDDTAEIQAAIDSLGLTGGTVLFPKGEYRISSALSVINEGTQLIGQGRWTTKITQATLNAKIIDSTAAHFRFSGIQLEYDGTPLSGATAISSTGSFSDFDNFRIVNAYVGMSLTDTSSQKLSHFDIRAYEQAGIIIQRAADIYLANFVMDAENTTRGSLGGIRLSDRAEAVTVVNGDILRGQVPMSTGATVNGVSTRPAFCKFANVYFDSAANGVSLDAAVEFDFTNCWFSNRPGYGIALFHTDGIRFMGGGALNCGTDGVVVTDNAVRTVFNGFAARGNSASVANAADGIRISANVTDFSITGCTLGGAVGLGTQRYGVNVLAGTSDRYIIADNLVTGNGTGGVSDNGSGANKRVANNY